MFEKISYSGGICSSGVIVYFSGFNLALDQTYKIKFDKVDSLPISTDILFNPTGYFLTPSETSPIVSTIFKAKSNISDNSSSNIISFSIYNNQNKLIYKDQKTIVCENLCAGGIPFVPTPSVTPTNTPTPTPQPPPPPPLNMAVSFDKLINKSSDCTILVRAKAYAYAGLNKVYSYSFGTDMSNINLQITNPSGNITITEIPQYIYTSITLPERDKPYYLEFGLSDGVNNVQTAAMFSCGDNITLNDTVDLNSLAFIEPQSEI